MQAIVGQTNYLYNNLDDNNFVFLMYLDFKKAFYSVQHDISLDKLQFYGVGGMPYEWFKSYLSGRKQYVYVNGVKSDTLNITHSVPQGCNLAPLLFLVQINDLPLCSDYFNYTMFADDCTLPVKFPRNAVTDIHIVLNNNISKIYHWLCANRIQINCNKTKYMLYSYRGINSLLGEITMGGSQIGSTDCTRFLGVFLDNKLTFKNHIDHISSKMSQSIGVLSKLNKFLPRNILHSLYFALVHPYISYSIEAWHSAPLYLVNKIQTIQKKAICCVNGLKYNDHTECSFRNMKLLDLTNHYKFYIAIYMYKALNVPNFDNNLLNSITPFASLHGHATRHSDQLVMPRYRKAKSQGSVSYQSIKLWNGIPAEIKNVSTLNRFKKIYPVFLCDDQN